ncbi:MAG: HipA domain-containing protein [Acidobacteriota bacterium]
MRPDEALPSESGDGQLLDAKTLAAYLKALPRRPLLVGGELRLSLAGAQDKLALVYRDGAFFLPRGQSATTHILKTEIEGFDNTVANEFFCLRLASRLGLDVPAVDMRRVEDVQFLMVERYDRVARGQSIQRLHQEDFCQALGVVPERKYQAEGGPSIVDCFQVLAACRYPARARLEFMRRVILNFLIGNADAHGKNFALLYPAARSKPRLAPLYDVLCTRAYLDHTDRMAMKIGGKRRFDTVLERHWRRLADDVEFAWPGVLRTCMDWSERVPELARKLADELGELGELQVIRRIIEVVDKGAETLPVGR